MSILLRSTIVVGLMVAAAGALAKGPKFTDPEKAGAAYKLQGEYRGEIPTQDGDKVLGVQVIALGNDQFQSDGYFGGLPGEGDLAELPSVKGKLEAGAVRFQAENGEGVLQNGEIMLYGPDGIKHGILEKVHRESPTLGQQPPKGAVVLYGGAEDADKWKGGRASDDGLLMQGCTSKQTFGSHKLHIEFRLPFQPDDRGQARGNSGVYVQGKYEVQMLDSFGLEGKQNECGGIYSVKDPDVNMCYPPLSWQTYDIDYTAARYDEQGKLTANPRMTVRHNGVVIHDDVELPGERNTTAAPVKAGSQNGPVYLQDHGCPVRYRNIWAVPSES